MAYPATQLITYAWYTSGIVARGLETVSGDQLADGLFLLNVLLDFKASDIRLIPYFTLYEWDLIQGQEMYFVPNLYDAETMTFNIADVRFPMNYANRDKYFGSGRVDSIQAIPFEWTLQRIKGGSNIYVYYLPQANYVSHLWGKFGLQDVTLATDMTSVYDPFYVEYLRYSLAQFYCQEYNIDFPPQKMMMLKTYEKKLQDVSPPDLTMQKTNFLNNKNSLNWSQINLGKGWTV